ncbi:DHA2 family efflux MFS transporter permease subunit [Pseudonocardia nematodicida]|uniref:DHA2 family efflux MFS transporter permease subunit n=1 Tax=Pseudonocardia nematodicida TaxID=1206997 RepID=A0ABV1KGA7_9PSEU
MATTQQPPAPERRRTSRAGALSALTLGLFMIVMDISVVAVAVPAIVRGLGSSLNDAVWVTSAYLLAYAAPMLVTSRLGDRFGPRRLFLVGTGVFTTASLACILVPTVAALIAVRAVQGVGAALLTPQTLTLVAHLYPAAGRGRAMGLIGASSGVATVTGPVLGGVLVDALGWQGIFVVNVALGVVTSMLGASLIPDLGQRQHRRLDPVGIVLSVTGLALLVFGIQNGARHDWGTIIGPVSVPLVIGTAIAVLAVFLIRQRGRDPLVPLSVFGDGNFTGGAVLNAAMGFVLTGILLPLVVHLQVVSGHSATVSGLFTAPMAVISALVGLVAGYLVDRVDPRLLMLPGLAFAATGLGTVSAGMIGAGPGTALLLGGLGLTGFGLGLVLVPVNTVAMLSLPPGLRGTASGVFFTARQLGAVLGSAVTAVVLQAVAPGAVREQGARLQASLAPDERVQFSEHVDRLADSELGAGALPAGDATWSAIALEAFQTGLARATASALVPHVVVVLLASVALLWMAPARRSGSAADQTT